MKKVLIIEDNENNLYLMRAIVEKMGHQAIEARDGEAGVKIAVAEKPDLILMDVQLPVLDGYAATKKIRATQGVQDIPIIAITSYAMVGDREKCLAAGCISYIEKPINPESVMEEIGRYLGTNEYKRK